MDELIRTAIGDKRLIAFTYHRCNRIAEPHVYGITKGKHQVLTYQVDGESRSGKPFGWKRVNLSDMSGLQVLAKHFPGARPTASGQPSHFDVILAVVE